MPKQQTNKTKEAIQELIRDDRSIVFYDGLEEAVVGTAERFNMSPVVAYDVEKILEIYMERDEMSYEEALEYFNYNTIGGWYGKATPVFIRKIETK